MPNVVNLKDSIVSTYEMRCGQSGTQTPYAKFPPQAKFLQNAKTFGNRVYTENADTFFM